MVDLRQVARELIESGWFLDASDAAADTEVIEALNDRGREIEDRAAAVIRWLGTRFKAFMGFSVLQKCTGKEVAWPN